MQTDIKPIQEDKMNNIDIANGIVFREMDIRKNTFDEWLISQKKIYLLQSLGTDLGYNFNWYLRGPYSPNLTNYVFENLDVLCTTDFNEYHLTQEAEINIQMVKNLENDRPSDMTTASWYELLAAF